MIRNPRVRCTDPGCREWSIQQPHGGGPLRGPCALHRHKPHRTRVRIVPPHHDPGSWVAANGARQPASPVPP
eukprot:scaffold23359_cov135-Isochrysis_galbana.AAC.4